MGKTNRQFTLTQKGPHIPASGAGPPNGALMGGWDVAWRRAPGDGQGSPMARRGMVAAGEIPMGYEGGGTAAPALIVQGAVHAGYVTAREELCCRVRGWDVWGWDITAVRGLRPEGSMAPRTPDWTSGETTPLFFALQDLRFDVSARRLRSVIDRRLAPQLISTRPVRRADLEMENPQSHVFPSSHRLPRRGLERHLICAGTSKAIGLGWC